MLCKKYTTVKTEPTDTIRMMPHTHGRVEYHLWTVSRDNGVVNDHVTCAILYSGFSDVTHNSTSR